MFIPFFLELKAARIPVSLREFLSLLEGMQANLAIFDVEAFFYLARTTLVKDERHLDRFDMVFSHYFKGLESQEPTNPGEDWKIPQEWLQKLAEKHLTEEEKKLVESLGGFQKLMETLQQRLKEQDSRHQGGSKWIGTAGTSPFGAYGYNSEGVRIGQAESRHRRAVKVWDRREFRNFDDSVELGTRNIKLALKRLRRWVREGAEEEFDLRATVRSTAEHGYLDIRTRPQRRNAVRLLMFFDVGGSMDDHVRTVEELFSAARAEFAHMEFFYFHNCLYEGVWKDNRRRHDERISTYDILHRFGREYWAIFVGDASMSPYEIVYPGGSVEHWNEEAGQTWLTRALGQWPNAVWLNPVNQQHWSYTSSISMIGKLFENRMFPLTLGGLEAAARELTHRQ